MHICGKTACSDILFGEKKQKKKTDFGCETAEDEQGEGCGVENDGQGVLEGHLSYTSLFWQPAMVRGERIITNCREAGGATCSSSVFQQPLVAKRCLSTPRFISPSAPLYYKEIYLQNIQHSVKAAQVFVLQ